MSNSKASNNKVGSPRYQAILDVAAKVFREKGYHHANISDIAARVGLQKGSLYHYIKCKEELLYEIFLSSMGYYMTAFQKILLTDKRCDIMLREAIVAHMAPVGGNYDRFYVGLHEFNSLTGEYKKICKEYLDTYEEMWLNILEQGKKEGMFLQDFDSKVTLLSIFGMCNWSLRWFKPGGKYTRKDLGRMFADRILNGIKA